MADIFAARRKSAYVVPAVLFWAATVLASTGWGQAEDHRRSQEAGFDYHLVKPIEPIVLRRLFADPLSRAASTE